MTLQEYTRQIREAVRAADVRDAIAGGLSRAYDDAIESGNSGAEVILARGMHETLGARLEEEEQEAEQLRNDADSMLLQMTQLENCVTVSETVPATLVPGQVCVVGRTG